MDWLKSIDKITTTVLHGIHNIFNISSNAVQEVRQENYSERHIHFREDGMILYAPMIDNNKYEIVLPRPCTETLHQAYSLFRTESKQEAEIKFIVLKDKVPVLLQLEREFFSVGNIQKLCDILMEHPTWTLAHLAAHFGLNKALADSKVNSLLNFGDLETGISPLQVAVQANNLNTVKKLIEAHSSLEHLDKKANTVYHYAATSSKEIIMALGSGLPNTLNSRNSDGRTPLHLACENDKPECVKALLSIRADVNLSSDDDGKFVSPSYVSDNLHNKPGALCTEEMKNGGTPLHWSCSSEVIRALIDNGCHIDALDFKGRTALHVMVKRKSLSCVIALLSHMASVNMVDKQGNTPLHFAVEANSPVLVKTLISFGADLNACNWQQETPRHKVNLDDNNGNNILYLLHAVGAERCPSSMQNCHIGCKYDDDYFGIALSKPLPFVTRTTLSQMLHVSSMTKMSEKSNKSIKGGRLLCLDGGGIRGLVLVQILMEIESILKRPIVESFDWIAGTSTGGILTLGLSAGKNLRECQALYFRLKDCAFIGSRPYAVENLEKILKDSYTPNMVMTDIKSPKVMITAVLADRKPLDLHLFRNYKSPADLLELKQDQQYRPSYSPQDQLVWKAARATSAAPSYFRPMGKFLDGGLIANNPTLDAMTEIQEYNTALIANSREEEVTPLSLVVSLGTGHTPLSQDEKNFDVFWPSNILDTPKIAWRFSALTALVIDQITASDGRVVDRARAWCSMIGVPYFRFNPDLPIDVSMDEKNDEILVNMIWTTKAFMQANRDQVKELADIINHHS